MTLSKFSISLLTTAALFASAHAAQANSFNLIQENAENEAVIAQSGSANVGNFYQGLNYNNLYTTQTGGSNATTTHQYGTNNTIASDVSGKNHKVTIFQGNKATGLTVRNAKVGAIISGETNELNVIQEGRSAADHESYNTISGKNNLVNIRQTSPWDGNYSDVQINGNSNLVSVDQLRNSFSQVNVVGSSNIAGVRQEQYGFNGNPEFYNRSFVSLTGNLNRGYVNQVGGYNRAGISMNNLTRSEASINQDMVINNDAFITFNKGPLNKAGIYQTGPAGNTYGYDNKAAIVVGGTNTYYNESYINQEGDRNTANLAIKNGYRNQQTINQTGRDNVAWIETDAKHSIAQIDQDGVSNATAGITQDGYMQEAYINQRGYGHQAYAVQKNNNNKLNITQSGSVGQYANVSQDGARNVTSVTQRR